MSCEYVSKKTGIKCESRSVKNSGLCGRHKHEEKRKKKPYDNFGEYIPVEIPDIVPVKIPEDKPENIIIPIIDNIQPDEETDIDELVEYLTAIFDKRYMGINSTVADNNNTSSGFNNILTSKPVIALGMALIPLILKRLNISDIYNNNASDLERSNTGNGAGHGIRESTETRKSYESTTTSSENQIQTGQTPSSRQNNDEGIKFTKLKF